MASTECTNEGLLPKSTLEVEHTKQSYPSNFGNEDFRDCPCFLPVGSIPILATECCSYDDSLKRVTEVANRAYREFLESEEGLNFNGQVSPSPLRPCWHAGVCTMHAHTRTYTMNTHTQTIHNEYAHTNIHNEYAHTNIHNEYAHTNHTLIFAHCRCV